MKTESEKPPTVSQRPAASISWNLVTHGIDIDGEPISNQLRSRIDQLPDRLGRFPLESLHLQVVLSRLDSGNRHRAELNLKLPPTVLHSEAEDADSSKAIDDAFETLETQLSEFIADLRGQNRWESAPDQSQGEPAETAAFGEPLQKGPQTGGDVLRNLILRHYHRLLLHAHRQVAGLDAASAIPSGGIDPREVLDEVVRICLDRPESKPAHLTYELWLYQLIREELDRECEALANEYRERAEFPAGDVEEEELDFSDAVALSLDPDESLEEERIADPGSLPPDLFLKESDLINEILEKTRHWPKSDRAIFDLHFLEGLDAVEIAMVKEMKAADVRQRIENLHCRLRDLLRSEAG